MFEVAQNSGISKLGVGAVDIRGRAFLAPMSGVTDLAMRNLAQKFGAGLVVSEMVASDDYVRGSAEARLRAEGGGLRPHVVQIAGCDPWWMAEAARVAEGAGADIVDINMGCPAKRVTGGWAGSALMRDLALAQRLIEATVSAIRAPVTLKMRLGWDSSSLNAPELARRAEGAGLQMITVHGRTRCMFYKGRADWTAIGAVVAATRLPVVANGDCENVEHARAMLAASGASAVMIGRAALGRPWLVGGVARALEAGGAVEEPSAPERREAALEHLDHLVHAMGVEKGLRHARKHLAAYADRATASAGPSPAHRRDRDRLVTSESVTEARSLLASMFDEERREAA